MITCNSLHSILRNLRQEMEVFFVTYNFQPIDCSQKHKEEMRSAKDRLRALMTTANSLAQEKKEAP
jgi:hypothetical protein